MLLESCDEIGRRRSATIADRRSELRMDNRRCPACQSHCHTKRSAIPIVGPQNDKAFSRRRSNSLDTPRNHFHMSRVSKISTNTRNRASVRTPGALCLSRFSRGSLSSVLGLPARSHLMCECPKMPTGACPHISPELVRVNIQTPAIPKYDCQPAFIRTVVFARSKHFRRVSFGENIAVR